MKLGKNSKLKTIQIWKKIKTKIWNESKIGNQNLESIYSELDAIENCNAGNNPTGKIDKIFIASNSNRK